MGCYQAYSHENKRKADLLWRDLMRSETFLIQGALYASATLDYYTREENTASQSSKDLKLEREYLRLRVSDAGGKPSWKIEPLSGELRSGDLIVMVVFGGMGSLFGPLFGAISLLVLEEGLSRVTEYWQIILGPMLLLIVLFARGGIDGLIGRLRHG